jgi:hypothetical protein
MDLGIQLPKANTKTVIKIKVIIAKNFLSLKTVKSMRARIFLLIYSLRYLLNIL